MTSPKQIWLVAMIAAAALVAPVGAVLADADPAVLEAQQRRIEVIERVSPAVVAIFSKGGRGGGSGVLISPDGYALTNFHVTRGAGDFMKCGLSDGVLYDGVIVGVDPTGDVALVKLLGRDDFPHVKLGDSDECKAGDWAYAMGNPFLLATDFQPTVTYGIISGVHRYQYPAGNNFLEYGDCIQIDTSINPGNSGGPLFNEAGELIGINGRGSFEKRGRVNSGAGYAISINQIKHFMGHLRSGRIVDHATLGATVYTEDDGAVVVDTILDDSDAYRRGLREGDEIVSFAGRPIRSVNQYKNILSIYPKGWKLPIVYRREGTKTTIYARLQALHHKSAFKPRRGRGPRPQPRPKDEKPKDDKKPDEKDPDDKKPDEKKPQPARRGRPTAKPPEKYKHMLVKKEGFANYYFNKLEQERTLAGLGDWGDFSGAKGAWFVSGSSGDDGAYEFSLTDSTLGLKFKGESYVQQLNGADLSDKPAGGLLLAMQHLKMLLTGQREKFTEFYYLGTEPLDGAGSMVDVMFAKLNVASTRFYVDPDSGRLLGLDTKIGEDVDACELRFGELKEFDGRKLPATISVTHGEEKFAALDLEEATFKAGETKADDSKNENED